MSKLLGIMPDRVTPTPMSKLTMDADPQAERFIVLDRSRMMVLRTGDFASGHIKSICLPPIYQHMNDILLLLLDDDRQFNAAILDGIKLEPVDGNIPLV